MSQGHIHTDIQAEVDDTVFNKCWPIRRALVVVIIFLYALITISFAANWAFVHSAFIDNGQSFWTVTLKLASTVEAACWEKGIAASMSTILADLYMVCATPLGISHNSSLFPDSRFGVAGWFGDNAGLLFCFQYFPWFAQLVWSGSIYSFHAHSNI